jgi:superfamily II DNA or RNA helicase
MSKINIGLTNNQFMILNSAYNIEKLIDKVTSFTMLGCQYSPKFLQKKWDGRIHLAKYKNRTITIPIGLLKTVRFALDKHNIEYSIIKRRITIKKRNMIFNEKIILRDYQKEAVESFCKTGIGILNMCIRSGKTLTAAAIIAKLNVKTLFVVPSKFLLFQVEKSLRKSIPNADIGIIGGGQKTEGYDITIITYQSFAAIRKKNKNSELCKSLTTGYDMIIVDEFHHSKSTEWKKPLLESTAKFRLGLSATVFFENEKEWSTGVIYLKAICGEICFKITMNELIKLGFLLQQKVELYDINKPKNLFYEPWSEELTKKTIHENHYRNNIIARLATKKMLDGSNVLIISRRLAQIDAISNLLKHYKAEHLILKGDTKNKIRKESIELFEKGKISILISNILNEGADIPNLECVIVADGGKDIKQTIQKLRNMTISPGKEGAMLIDFYDSTNVHLREHSKERIKVYESELFAIERKWGKK